MVNVRYLWQKGNNFAKVCLKMNDSDEIDSKLVLSTLAIEILVKSNIAVNVCKKFKDNNSVEEIENAIGKKFKQIGHNLVKLFDSIQDLKKEMNIISIERVNKTGFVDEYRFMLVNERLPLIFKTLEASRYGGFSSNRDILTIVNRTKEDIFLERLSKITNNKIKSMFEYLKKDNDINN